MSKKRYDLTPSEALEEMDVQLRKMRAETNRSQLRRMSPDDAYEAGYEAAIADFEHFTGPDPKITYDDAAGKLARGELDD